MITKTVTISTDSDLIEIMEELIHKTISGKEVLYVMQRTSHFAPLRFAHKWIDTIPFAMLHNTREYMPQGEVKIVKSSHSMKLFMKGLGTIKIIIAENYNPEELRGERYDWIVIDDYGADMKISTVRADYLTGLIGSFNNIMFIKEQARCQKLHYENFEKQL